jgi:hypothetical protein
MCRETYRGAVVSVTFFSFPAASSFIYVQASSSFTLSQHEAMAHIAACLTVGPDTCRCRQVVVCCNKVCCSIKVHLKLRLLLSGFAINGLRCMLLCVLMCRLSNANDGRLQLQRPDAVAPLGESVGWT